MVENLKILLISYYYGNTASGVISKRVAGQLTKRGHKVIVVTQSEVEVSGEKESGVEVVSVKDIWNQGGFISRIIQKIKRSNYFYLPNYSWVNKATIASCRIVDKYKPDIVYCRTSPEDACYVGYNIHKKYGIPTLQHFSDPVPAPLEYLPCSRKRKSLIKRISEVLKAATIVSYGNESMLKYVEEAVGMNLHEKSFVSPDMASGSEIQYVPAQQRNTIVLVFFGSLYGGRNPYPLFESIKDLNKNGYKIELQVYSKIGQDVLTIFPFVKSMEYNSNTIEVLSKANILIDLDGDDEIPVFISSKLKDYLLINRPILSITPTESPSRKLLEGLASVRVVENEKEKISKAIIGIMGCPVNDNQYIDRKKLIDYFSPDSVVENLLSEINKVCNNYND